MRCLLINNYDSFTWNLAHYAAEAFGTDPIVVYNNEYSWEELKAADSFDCIIVSPGPGNVVNEKDFHTSRQAVMQTDIPVLGVCLGMQGIGHFHGAEIVHAPTPYHGRSSLVRHTGEALFSNIPSPFSVVRYHSLIVDPVLPEDIVITAKTDSGIIMALRHKVFPKWGVQFHPESVNTDYGHRLVENFRDLAHQHLKRAFIQVPFIEREEPAKQIVSPQENNITHRKVIARKIEKSIDPESIFMTLYEGSEHVFWLDGASVEKGMPGFSFMGSAKIDKVRSYSLSEDTDEFEEGHRFLNKLEQDLEDVKIEGGDDLPFSFRGGWVGYFTYEMKALFGANVAHINNIPDALWICAEQFIAYDHFSGTAWAVSIVDDNEVGEEHAQQWVTDCCNKISNLKRVQQDKTNIGLNQFTMNMTHSYKEYLAAIDHCKKAIVDGESYEICLTNQFCIELNIDPVALYLELRKKNPAPFAAFVRSGPVSILSSSPERFLKVDEQGKIQAKPMKGTISRSNNPGEDKLNALELEKSDKDRAENLMIVDLMRNDLSRVSVVGSVSVPNLMDVETFATVHQMVSTIESQIKPECTLIDVIRSSFPGGSISGAPKLRTMEIIDKLEKRGRGVYCGAIGYLGYNRVADLNIAIRTLWYDEEKITFGAGGAVTYLSDADKEFEEMIVKSKALLGPIWSYLGSSDENPNYQLDDNKMHIFGVLELRKTS